MPGKVLRPQNVEKFVFEQKCWHHLSVSSTLQVVWVPCATSTPLYTLLDSKAGKSQNHFSSCEYSQTSAGDTYKDMFSVSWEELGVNHLNGSVNAIAQHHHHTIIPTNLKLLKPGNHLEKGWQTTYLKPNPHVFTEPAN